MSKQEPKKVRWIVVRLNGSCEDFTGEVLSIPTRGDGSRPRNISVTIIGDVSTPASEVVTGYGHVIFAKENPQ